MKLFSKLLLALITVAALAWFLPWVYALAFPTSDSQPFMSFSPVNDKWIISRASANSKPTIQIVDSILPDGTMLTTDITREERDSLVPQTFYKELLAKEKLPDTVAGIAVSAHELRSHEIMLNSSPRDIVKRHPGVWMMMESMPERVELSDADQVFRFTEGSDGKGAIEFVDMASNKVNKARSRRFAETLRARGFAFPAVDLSANVTSRKVYDEGYLMIDSEGRIFHVKQQAGMPYVAAVKMPQGVKASKVFILEENNRDILGLVVDTDNHAWFLEREGYKLMPLPIGEVDPRKENVLMMGNLFNFTFRIVNGPDGRWMAVKRTPDGYRLAGQFENHIARSSAAKAADWLFPFTLSFTSTSDSLAYPRLTRWSGKAALVYLAAIALIIGGVSLKRRKHNNNNQ